MGDGADVDFVVGEPPPPELDHHDVRGSGGPSPRRILVLAAAVLAAFALVGTVIDRQSGSPPRAARPTSAPAPSTPIGAVPGLEMTVYPGPVAPDQLSRLATCPEADDGGSACNSTSALPLGVLTAIQAAFPGAQLTSARSEQLRDVGFGPGGLWFREVRATAGRTSLVIVIGQRAPHDTNAASALDDGAASRVYAVHVMAKLTVSVQVTLPSGATAPIPAATALSRDPRLVSQ
jgi:hypothetical protein